MGDQLWSSKSIIQPSGNIRRCCALRSSDLQNFRIGGVGENPPFLVGNQVEIYSNYAGTLQLSINDCGTDGDFSDNGDILTVSVVIAR